MLSSFTMLQALLLLLLLFNGKHTYIMAYLESSSQSHGHHRHNHHYHRYSSLIQFQNSRYFAVEKWIPPMQSFSALKNNNNNINYTTLTIPYSSMKNSNSNDDNNPYCRPLHVVYTNHPKVVQQWLHDHVPRTTDGVTCLGFDVESVPAKVPWIRNPNFLGPATIQLATTEASLIVQLVRGSNYHNRGNNKSNNGNNKNMKSYQSSACFPVLESVLNDPSIIKVGCNIDQDMVELYDCWKSRASSDSSSSSTSTNTFFDAKSRLDLSHVMYMIQQSSSENEIMTHNDRQLMGLKRLSEKILNIELEKSRKTIVSDWSTVPLSNAQIQYSARDAWVGACIYEQFMELHPDQMKTIIQQIVPQQSQSPSSTQQQQQHNTKKNQKQNIKVSEKKSKHQQQNQQLPVRELYIRYQRRKRAKRIISKLNSIRYRRHDDNDDDNNDTAKEENPKSNDKQKKRRFSPKSIAYKVRVLKRVVKQNEPDKLKFK